MTKEWLNRGYMINKEIDALMEQKNILHSKATSTTSNLSSEPANTFTINSNEAKFISYVDYSKLLDERIDELYDVKQEILECISKVNDVVLRTLLIERYINFKKWEQIAGLMNYSYMHICRLHNKALNIINII